MATFHEAFSALSTDIDRAAKLRRLMSGNNVEEDVKAIHDLLKPQPKEQVEKEKKPKREFLTKRPFRAKMKYLAPDWADKIWGALTKQNASWMPAVATLALTGMRPASLKQGVVYSIVKDKTGRPYLQAHFKGAKIIPKEGTPDNRRGQDWVKIQWSLDPLEPSHRRQEFDFILAAVRAAPGQVYTVTHGAEVISNQLRDLSKKLWPRRKTLVSAVCYREMLSSVAKGAGVERADLAMAMGHISEESAGAYQRRAKDGIPLKPFSRVFAKQAPKAQKESSLKQLKKFKSGSKPNSR